MKVSLATLMLAVGWFAVLLAAARYFVFSGNTIEVTVWRTSITSILAGAICPSWWIPAGGKMDLRAAMIRAIMMSAGCAVAVLLVFAAVLGYLLSTQLPAGYWSLYGFLITLVQESVLVCFASGGLGALVYLVRRMIRLS